MAVKEVLTLGNPVLRKVAEKVDLKKVKKRNFQNILKDMFDTMESQAGIGLAAPQIGVSLRFFVKGLEETDRYPEMAQNVQREVVINPEIEILDHEDAGFWEGCLSVPGFVGEVDRSESVTIKGQNRRGQSMRIKAKGWLARIFQHEIDHLDGILFTDRAERVWKTDEEPIQAVSVD